MINKKKSVPKKLVLIDCIHVFLLNNADNEGKIPRKQIPTILGRGLHIHKINHRRILKELEFFGVVIDTEKNFVKVKKKELSV